MKRIAMSVALLSAVLVLGACGESEETSAQEYATKACHITWVDDAGNAVDPGKGEPVYEAFDGEGYDVSTESVPKLKEWSAEWKVQSTDAAAAAQLDPSWIPLSNAASTINEKLSTLVILREDGWLGQNFWNQSTYTASDLQQHVDAHTAYDTQCAALASRL